MRATAALTVFVGAVYYIATNQKQKITQTAPYHRREKVRLDSWCIGTHSRLIGQTYGHSTIKDGTTVVTAELVEFDLEARFAKTETTDYTLGYPMVANFPVTLQ